MKSMYKLILKAILGHYFSILFVEVSNSFYFIFSKKTMLLTLWDQFAENQGATIASMISTTPDITALNVKVSLYNSKL